MSINAILYGIEFNNFLLGKEYDAIIIRGDRYEMLGLAMCALYNNYKIIHIEGGDESGVVDNKVRHAITQLSDYHFCTNEESHKRIIQMGISPNRVYNYGSLDVEYAKSVEDKKPKKENYILVCYHPIPKENETELEKALKGYDVISIGSNKDYGRGYGKEEYPPQDYINLLKYARLCVGNSSSFLKEASIFGTPIVLVGDRQQNRIKPKSVLSVPCETEAIKKAIEYQMTHTFEPDIIYYKEGTSQKIAEKLNEIL